MNPFTDHAHFMRACDQTVGVENKPQLELYVRLIHEELDELIAAMTVSDRVEILDAITDILVVTVGAGLSQFTPEQLTDAWNEVWMSNMSKVNPDTGVVDKREDGKVLKGPAYVAPNLGRLV